MVERRWFISSLIEIPSVFIRAELKSNNTTAHSLCVFANQIITTAKWMDYVSLILNVKCTGLP